MLRVDEVIDSDQFPSRSDVVVVGGGIIGACTAYELARRGVSVTLLEKGFIGAEQSGRNWGWVRQQNRDYYELPVAIRSLQRWPELAEEIGLDLGFRKSGILYGTEQKSDIERWEKWLKGAKQFGFESEILSEREVKNRLPTSRGKWVGGLWSPTDGRAEPSKAAPAIATGAQRYGATVLQTCAVRGLDISAGRISGVVTERGVISASHVVLAGGAWNGRLCRRHGIEIPVANVIGSAMRTTIDRAITQGCLSGPNFALRRRLDGSYTIALPGHGRMELAPQGIRNATRFYQLFRSKISKKLKFRVGRTFFNGPEAAGSWDMDRTSPFEQVRILNPAPDVEWLEHALQSVKQVFPELSNLRIAHAWAGAIDTTPDLLPLISTVATIPGLILASGFSGHGFGLGPGVGELISDIVANNKPYADPHPFRLDRFSDGSVLGTPQMM